MDAEALQRHQELSEACKLRDQLAEQFHMFNQLGQGAHWMINNRTALEHVVRTFKKHIDEEPWKSVIIRSDNA